MEQRLIDANALDFNDKTITQIAEMIDNAPTVDAVAVVRCGECKHYIDSECRMHNRIYFRPNNFCSYGERKQNELLD